MRTFDNIEFGQSVAIYNRLERKSEYISSATSRYMKCFWEEVDLEPVRGIFIGVRTLSNGKCGYYTDHSEYTPDFHFKSALVVINKNENPFYSTNIKL